MRRFLGQQLGAFVYKDPPLQIANHDLSESAGVFWTHTAGGTSTASAISGMQIQGRTFYAGAETIYWGDSTTSAFSVNGTALSHAYPSNGPKDTPKFAEGVITDTSNHYMDKTFIRGSSKVMEKLI